MTKCDTVTAAIPPANPSILFWSWNDIVNVIRYHFGVFPIVKIQLKITDYTKTGSIQSYKEKITKRGGNSKSQDYLGSRKKVTFLYCEHLIWVLFSGAGLGTGHDELARDRGNTDY